MYVGLEIANSYNPIQYSSSREGEREGKLLLNARALIQLTYLSLYRPNSASIIKQEKNCGYSRITDALQVAQSEIGYMAR